MAVKFLQNQNLTKLERDVNKALAAAKGGLRLHSLTADQGMITAVLETAPAPAELIAEDKPAKAKDKAKDKAAEKPKR